MQQHIYCAGRATPEGLADAIVEESQSERRLRAQKVSGGNVVLVQIGRWEHHHLERAVTVGIAYKPDDQRYIVVSLGERDWVQDNVRAQAVRQLVAGGLVSVLISPWSLFSMISPAERLLGGHTSSARQWELIERVVLQQGGMLAEQHSLTPPL